MGRPPDPKPDPIFLWAEKARVYFWASFLGPARPKSMGFGPAR